MGGGYTSTMKVFVFCMLCMTDTLLMYVCIKLLEAFSDDEEDMVNEEFPVVDVRHSQAEEQHGG